LPKEQSEVENGQMVRVEIAPVRERRERRRRVEPSRFIEIEFGGVIRGEVTPRTLRHRGKAMPFSRVRDRRTTACGFVASVLPARKLQTPK
jgi:hypothetical protein